MEAAAMTESVSLLKAMAASVDLWQQHQRARAAPDLIPDAIPMTKELRVLAAVNNPSGGATPPLTILKRQEEPMNFSDLIKSADRLLKAGRYEEANEAADAALRMVEKAKARTHEDDDNTVDDTWSSAADDDEDDDDDDDNGNNVRKWSDSYSIPGYGGTPSPEQPEDTRLGPRHRTDTYNTGITPVSGQPPLRTKFDSRIDMIQARDGVSRSIAMTKARTEFPRDYTTYQQLSTELPTNEQHMTRRPVGANKRAPSTYEDLVSEQMAKGCNYEIAKVRVAQLHGYDAQRMPSLMRKGADLGDRFQKIVKSLSYENNLSLEDATRLAAQSGAISRDEQRVM
jgi:hypothetical protein